MSIPKLSKCLALFREQSATFPLTHAQVLMEVISDEGLNQTELVERLDSSRAAISRAMVGLGEWERKDVPGLRDKPGLGLVISEMDPNDRRQRRLWLTPKGKRFAKQLESCLAG